MIALRSLRGRLTAGHAAIVLVAIVSFAATAGILLSSLQREVSDARLRSAATALQVIVERTGTVAERSSLMSLSRSGLSAAVIMPNGRVAVASDPVPDAVRFAAVAHPDRTTIVKGTSESGRIRMIVFPVAGGAVSQTGVFWRTVDTIADVDLHAALIFMLLTPLIVALAFVACDRLTRSALAPLFSVTAMATTIEATDLGKRIPPQSATTEVADLCATLNRMFARLESAFARQRRFTADASHELRTPLSVIMAEADLGSQGMSTQAEYAQSMRVILREAHTIESLTSELLLLAREEAGIPRVPAHVDVAHAATSAIERLSGLAHMRRITVHARTDANALVLADRDAITRIPLSLLHNALRFSNEDTRIDVSVDANRDQIRLTVEDEGPGFTNEGLERAYERFWRGDPSRQGTGSGLGLAIVHSLVASANGTIEIVNRPERGCRVVVCFPAATPGAVTVRTAPRPTESVR
jgi:two-component system OmpR family sensor kinase